MGTAVRVDVRCGGAGAEAVEAVFAWLRLVDAMFSTYDPGSEISRIGRGALPPAAAHPLVREVLGRCDALRAETGGAFDARAAGRAAGLSVDPTGLVKGWAVERAAALLEAAGARRFLIDAGGDVVVRGGAWRVGIRHPRRRGRLAAVVTLDDGAVATSGAYERGPHIVDPRTGRPATGALSVSVLGPDLGTADAYATAAFAMGSRGPAWTAGQDGYEAMTIVPGDRVLATPGFLRRCPGGSAARSLGRA